MGRGMGDGGYFECLHDLPDIKQVDREGILTQDEFNDLYLVG